MTTKLNYRLFRPFPFPPRICFRLLLVAGMVFRAPHSLWYTQGRPPHTHPLVSAWVRPLIHWSRHPLLPSTYLLPAVANSCWHGLSCTFHSGRLVYAGPPPTRPVGPSQPNCSMRWGCGRVHGEGAEGFRRVSLHLVECELHQARLTTVPTLPD